MGVVQGCQLCSVRNHLSVPYGGGGGGVDGRRAGMSALFGKESLVGALRWWWWWCGWASCRDVSFVRLGITCRCLTVVVVVRMGVVQGCQLCSVRNHLSVPYGGGGGADGRRAGMSALFG